jgi:tetratricopeptide (TPR) repeat protein
LEKNGRHFDAMLAYERAIRFNPMDYRPRYLLGRLLLRKNESTGAKNLFEAMNHLKTAFILNPADYRIELLVLQCSKMLHMNKKPVYSELKRLCRKYPHNQFLKKLKMRTHRKFTKRRFKAQMMQKWKKRFGEPKSKLTGDDFVGVTKNGVREVTGGNLYWNADIFAMVRLHNKTGKLIITAWGNEADGVPPEMLIYLNDKPSGVFSVKGSRKKKYVVQYDNMNRDRAWLQISFTNDGFSPDGSQDRNLFIDSVESR